MEKTAFKLPFGISPKYLQRQTQKGVSLHGKYDDKDDKKKEAGILSPLRRLVAAPAKRLGVVKTIGGGAMMGAAGGAAHGLANAQPGQSKIQAMKSGAKSGAMVGAAGGAAYRGVGNKILKGQHARQMAAL